MTTYTLDPHDLTYHFRQDEKVLDTIALQVPTGAIYGFLGPNGAGKTTTLKLVLGLLRNQQGTIRIFGKEIIHERMTILQRIGSLIESPSLYHHLTAVENLQVLQKLYGAAVEGKVVLESLSRSEIAIVNQQLVTNGIQVYEINAVQQGLEDIFMNIIHA